MKHILVKLLEYQYLSRNEARELLMAIVRGELPDTQVSALITIFLMRSISVEEVLGFREALVEMRVPVELKEYGPSILSEPGRREKHLQHLHICLFCGCRRRISRCETRKLRINIGQRIEQRHGAAGDQIHHRHKYPEKKHRTFQHRLPSCPALQPGTQGGGTGEKKSGCKKFLQRARPTHQPVRSGVPAAGVYDLSMARLYSYIYQASRKSSASFTAWMATMRFRLRGSSR